MHILRRIAWGPVAAAAIHFLMATPGYAASVMPLQEAAAAATGQATVELDAVERQLAAIREALMERALEAPTRVLSVGWIDEKGSLHETSQFRTDAHVRGIRVLNYLDAEGGGTQADISVEIDLPASLRASMGADGLCGEATLPWRTPVTLQWMLDPGLRGQQSAIARWVSEEFAALFQAASGDLRRWAVTRGDEGREVGSSRYMRALSGKGNNPPDWQLRLTLQHSTTVSGAAGLSSRPVLRSAVVPWLDTTRAVWHAVLILQRAGEAGAHFRVEETIEVSKRSADTAEQLIGRLAARLPDWIAALDQQRPCEPPQFALASRTRGAWSIEAGESTGLRVGDRVLVVDRRSVPRRLLEPGAARLMAVAEVSRVTRDHVNLRQVAGPGLPDSGEWVAFPF